MKRILLVLLFFVGLFSAVGQTKSPDQFLGYPLGSKFTIHHKVNDYFKYVASQHKNIQLISYGKTYEGRELLVAVISSQNNINNLEDIRKNNVAMSKASGSLQVKKQPAILWLSYNVHGNEASSTETAMKMIYTLSQAQTPEIQQYLNNTVVMIDPCLNPDGRDRFVQHFNSVVGIVPDANPNAREHQEPWPRGRVNHYYFDLNRDWAWQTQIETTGRIALYQQWMPQVHVDFHEQSYNSPYYFAPAAEPVHESINSWQREFQVIVGKNNAKQFDAQGWQYFTKESFDLLYPSYGDTYPLYNGAIGMTYEQGGIGAGLSVLTAAGDTLTLKDRIDHHFTTGMATIQTVSEHAEKLVSAFKSFFVNASAKPTGLYKSYVVKATHLSRLKKLAALLDKNHIEYNYGGDRSYGGLDFATRKKATFKLERNDLVINMHQPRATLASVLFEPQTNVTDSNTYDITAWALPYAYGLQAYALTESIKGNFTQPGEEKTTAIQGGNPYAWAFSWNTVEDAKVLIALQQAKLRVRMAEEAFSSEGKSYPAGTLLVYRKENDQLQGQLAAKLQTIATTHQVQLNTITSGFVEKGKDFGSSVYPLLKMPKVAVVSGAETFSQSVGEVWNFFEQELHYPVSMLSVQSLGSLNVEEVNVLILPAGNYPKNLQESLLPWVQSGGKLILMEEAIKTFAGVKPYGIKLKEFPKQEQPNFKSYRDKGKDDLNNAIPGAIYKVNLDHSHPLTLGLSQYYTLISDDKIYEPLEDGWNVGMLKPGSYVTGIAGENARKKMESGLLFGVQPLGNGTVVYLATDVLFRMFWESGKQVFSNAIFAVR
ncbi:M14 metallopeptidase family protein [Pedobacter sp.]|uniref:M14 family metallopeptidase n=1 Tax=Pedobacter sp. TaxID=1411316 RepID=UPI003D7F1C5B